MGETAPNKQILRGLSQAVACDGLTYTVFLDSQNSDVQQYPLPLFEDQNYPIFDWIACWIEFPSYFKKWYTFTYLHIHI